MSCMTMNMSARHILGFDAADTEWRQAKTSGWRRADLRWERLTETAIAAWTAGRRLRAVCLFRLAYWQARQAFGPGDRRTATSLINLGIAAGSGTVKAKRYFAKARHHWQASRGDVDDMVVRPRARSSLFHLRMEARHRETYLVNARLRISRIIAETGETLDALETGMHTLPHRHFSRWRGERPVAFDDMRKILAACLLIADPV